MPRVNPGGWLTGQPLTATQANDLDIAQADHEDRLDTIEADYAETTYVNTQDQAYAPIAARVAVSGAISDAGGTYTMGSFAGESGVGSLSGNSVDVPNGPYIAILSGTCAHAGVADPSGATIKVGTSGDFISTLVTRHSTSGGAVKDFCISGLVLVSGGLNITVTRAAGDTTGNATLNATLTLLRCADI